MKKIIIPVLLILSIFTGCQSVMAMSRVELKTGVNLGEGAGEIADILAERLNGQAFLIVYEAMEVSEFDREVVSTIMFFLEKDDQIYLYNLPLRRFLKSEEARKIAREVNGHLDTDYLMINLGYFIEVIDLYEGIEVETAQGLKFMDSKAAEAYLRSGLYDGYPFDHRARQENLMNGIIAKMTAYDGNPDFLESLSILSAGVQRIESNLSFLEKSLLGLRFINYGFENIEFYQPLPENY
ncbi:MAG: hypothetical protein ACOC1W_02345 [Bacillota bacterium]